ncbi:MAG: competence/damage-inducible protein A [Clostridia bacterium]|nr:competence/damage-inducible protein A [Clostridia bacterium]
MKAEIITIGDELLIGQVVDTNSAWMAEQLNLVGLQVHQITSISDDRSHILSALTLAAQRANVILITGGLGPTNDDLTKPTLCEYFDTPLIFHQPTFDHIEQLFGQRGYAMSEVNRHQADVPQSCTVIPNLNGTAPGMWFEHQRVIYVSMPGVPFEMKPMMLNEILPRLLKRFEGSFILHRTVLTQGIGESALAETIETWENSLPANIKLAYLPQPGMVRLRLTATGDDKQALAATLQHQIDKLLKTIPDLIFGFNDDSLESVVGQLLLQKHRTISTAESCTGGYLAHLITSVAGSSTWYMGSVVAYHNRIKMQALAVPKKMLEAHGAVSQQVVEAMAQGIRTSFGTDYALAVSGIAGPDGGSAEKPVGTTWIALATTQGVTSRKFLFGEHRQRNIRKAALAALNMLRLELLKE